jgi:hypothetical protein
MPAAASRYDLSVGRYAHILKHKGAHQQGLIAGKRIEGATNACNLSQGIEAVHEIDRRHLDCTRTQGRTKEANVIQLVLRDFIEIGLLRRRQTRNHGRSRDRHGRRAVSCVRR